MLPHIWLCLSISFYNKISPMSFYMPYVYFLNSSSLSNQFQSVFKSKTPPVFHDKHIMLLSLAVTSLPSTLDHSILENLSQQGFCSLTLTLEGCFLLADRSLISLLRRPFNLTSKCWYVFGFCPGAYPTFPLCCILSLGNFINPMVLSSMH